jgi:hypothetical protein
VAEIVVMGALWAVAQWFVILAYHASERRRLAFAYSQIVWASLLGCALLAQFRTRERSSARP